MKSTNQAHEATALDQDFSATAYADLLAAAERRGFGFDIPTYRAEAQDQKEDIRAAIKSASAGPRPAAIECPMCEGSGRDGQAQCAWCEGDGRANEPSAAYQRRTARPGSGRGAACRPSHPNAAHTVLPVGPLPTNSPPHHPTFTLPSASRRRAGRRDRAGRARRAGWWTVPTGQGRRGRWLRGPWRRGRGRQPRTRP